MEITLGGAYLIDPMSLRRAARRFLIMIFSVAFALSAITTNAAGTWAWSASVTVGNNFASTTQTYPTKPQAIAAMRALFPTTITTESPAMFAQQTAVLVESSINQMAVNTVSYQFTAPPVNLENGPWTGYAWYPITGTPPYSSEAGAVAAITSPTCVVGTNSYEELAVPAGAWAPYTAIAGAPVPYETQDMRPYSTTVEEPTNNCVPQQGSITLYRIRTVFCQTGYILNTAPPYSCGNAVIGTVSGQLLECASNGSPSTSVGDPCDVATGDFSQTETDYSAAGLNFTRNYHSAVLEAHHAMGVGWTHNYASYLILGTNYYTGGPAPIGLLRPDGHHDFVYNSNLPGAPYISLSGAGIQVQQSGNDWIALLRDGSSEVYSGTGQLTQKVAANGLITTLSYNTANQLATVTGPFGSILNFSYNASGQLQQLTDPSGKIIAYAYDADNNLISATYQDSSVRKYLYEDSSLPNNLTGLIDENAGRFLTVSYNDATGAVISSTQAGGAQAVSITYSANGAVATDALGATNTYTFTTGTTYPQRATSFAHNSLTQNFTVPTVSTDVQRRVTQSIDANGDITNFAYDKNHMTSKTEAYGTPSARTTAYQYLNTTSALPTLVTEALRTTAYVYYPATNNINTKTVTDTTVTPNVSRTWTYSYYSNGQLETVDGPRTDVSDITTYAYYTCSTGSQCGQVQTITNALNQVTTFNTYNAYGQPLTITDPNGVVRTLTYDKRLRLLSQEVGTETTSYSYYPTGLLETVTLPDSSTVSYAYDGAHRLTKITDGAGNYISYTLDSMGNRTAENTYDPAATLHRTHTRVFNVLNELYQDINSAGTAAVTTTLAYDNNGNVTSSSAPLSRNTSDQYDALNRLTQVTDPKSGITKLSYDANDSLASVIDPRSMTTSYTHNGFGDVTQLVSPDTGTSLSTYDSAGNLKTATDARSALATYSYDAMNRVTQVAYADQTIHFTYDAGTNGIGRLTGASDTNHSMSWTYDTHGRITGKGQTIGTITKSVGYAYTNGDLTSLVTPSGQTIVYSYTNHRITSITINGAILLNSATYDPFGPATGWTWGNSTASTRSFDKDGNPSQIITAGVTNGYTIDNASRITGLSDSGLSSNSFTFGYDLLDRVTSGTSTGKTRGYTYDANSNRLTTTGTTASTETISTTNNRLNSTSGGIVRTYGYDNAGNTTSFTGDSFTYNDRGRVSQAIVNGSATNYIYNALSQLIEKSGNGGTTLLVYDEAGHILGEYSGTGALVQETIWMGDTPVATLRPNGSSITVYYVHADHLATPRKVTRPSDNGLMWRWDPDTFGSVAPNTNPAGLGAFTYNLRFPGQYSLSESGLYYNYFRTYDPQMGRYVESDPIGLSGGVNTYAYARENPIMRGDPSGLFSLRISDTMQMVDTIPRYPDALGYTGYSVGVSCTCTCGSPSTLIGCNAHINIAVQIKNGFSPYKETWVKHGESQHVLDLADAGGSYRKAGQAIEDDIKSRGGFSSQEECKRRSENAVTNVLLDAVAVAYGQSIDRWDRSGEHTWWPWR